MIQENEESLTVFNQTELNIYRKLLWKLELLQKKYANIVK